MTASVHSPFQTPPPGPTCARARGRTHRHRSTFLRAKLPQDELGDLRTQSFADCSEILRREARPLDADEIHALLPFSPEGEADRVLGGFKVNKLRRQFTSHNLERYAERRIRASDVAVVELRRVRGGGVDRGPPGGLLAKDEHSRGPATFATKVQFSLATKDR